MEFFTSNSNGEISMAAAGGSSHATDASLDSNQLIELTDSLALASGVISIVSTLIMLFCFSIMPHLRKSMYQIFYLSICDLFVGIAFTLNHGYRASKWEASCQVQSWMLQFFELSSLFWTTQLCTMLYSKIYHYLNKADNDPGFLMVKRICSSTVWLLALVLTIIPAGMRAYGPSGAWCWIESTAVSEGDTGTRLRFGVFYAWVWLAIAANAFLLFKIFRFAKQAGVAEERRIFRLGLYPVVAILIWVCPTINRIALSIDPEHQSRALWGLQSFFEPLQGFGNILVYGMNPTVRTELRKALVSRGWERLACCLPGDGKGGNGRSNSSADDENAFSITHPQQL